MKQTATLSINDLINQSNWSPNANACDWLSQLTVDGRSIPGDKVTYGRYWSPPVMNYTVASWALQTIQVYSFETLLSDLWYLTSKALSHNDEVVGPLATKLISDQTITLNLRRRYNYEVVKLHAIDELLKMYTFSYCSLLKSMRSREILIFYAHYHNWLCRKAISFRWSERNNRKFFCQISQMRKVHTKKLRSSQIPKQERRSIGDRWARTLAISWR